MIYNEKHLKEILLVLNEDNILKDTILIGSWSLLFYDKVFLDFEPEVRTTDLDFYVPNAKAIVSNGGLTDSLKELNYEMVMDTLTSKTTFASVDGFELEFLTKLNRSGLSCVKLGNTGIYAESLSYIEIFTGNYIEVDYEGMKVKVASPASYILQKLLINDKRPDVKKEKDIQSIKKVLFYVKASSKSFEELTTLYDSLPKTWKKKINKITKESEIDLLTPITFGN